MYEKFRALLGLMPVDPFAHYGNEQPSGPFAGLPESERRVHEIVRELLRIPVRRIFVVAGTDGVCARIVEASADAELPRDGWLEGFRDLVDLTDTAGREFLDWAGSQPGLVEFDQYNGRLRRAIIDLSHYRSPERA